MEMVRRLALILAMAFLAISLVVAYYTANSSVSIWFEDRYVVDGLLSLVRQPRGGP